MNTNQRVILGCGGLALALMCLFPPWRAESVAQRDGRVVPSLSGPSDIRVYRLLFSPPSSRMEVLPAYPGMPTETVIHWYYTVDLESLAAQVGAILFLTLFAWAGSGREPEPAQGL